jgi:uncharacterized membrane protein YoaK (UPF0700 family)
MRMSSIGGSLLAGVAGYVDTLGFVALFGLFTAHVTGNFVLIGSELARHGHGVLLKLLVFPAFVMAVAIGHLIGRYCERRGRSSIRPLLICETLLLCGFLFAGVWASPIKQSDSMGALLAGMLGGMAMGVQNCLSRQALAKLTPTTIMTGNVTQLVMDAVDWLIGEATPDIRARIGKLFFPVLAFGLGAIGGAMGYVRLGFTALLLPLCLLLVLIWKAESLLTEPRALAARLCGVRAR